MVDETVKMISICGFEGMFARVAQWWSIALPRRGSRVRIPSRALKEIEKESSDRWLFFLCSSPAGLERFECLRSDALIVDVNFLGAVLALRIAGSMDNDLLDKLMQDTWSQFRNFRIPFYNGEKPLHLRTPAESRQVIFFA